MSGATQGGGTDGSGTDGGGARHAIRLNGEPRTVPAGTALETLIAGLTAAPSGVAAAVNETVVPRGRWAATELREGDRVEVLTAVQGG